jgi:hypothetical protein
VPLKFSLIGGGSRGGEAPLPFYSPSPRVERGTKGVRLINKNKCRRVWEEKHGLKRG